ncbi:MAG TPA: HEPN domain-containing protein [Rhizomicrobium sp.]|jgi:uncharacterized protein (UPF0332 family)
MSPEASDFMVVAEHMQDRAAKALKAELYEDAARNAYLAALNAARAVVFEEEGVAVKTHAGAKSQLLKLIQQGLPFDRDIALFLNDGFDLKQMVDYGPVVPVERATAEEFIASAKEFLHRAKLIVDDKRSGRRTPPGS